MKSKKESDRSRYRLKLGQAGVGADDEGSTIESCSTDDLRSGYGSEGLTNLLIELAPQMVPPPAVSSQPIGSQLDCATA